MPRRADREDLAPTVILLRAIRGWNRKQLADAAGMDKSQLARYELGQEIPSPRTLERLAAAVGVKAHHLGPITAFIRGLQEDVAAGRTSPAPTASSTSPGSGFESALAQALDRTVSQARVELTLHTSRMGTNE